MLAVYRAMNQRVVEPRKIKARQLQNVASGYDSKAKLNTLKWWVTLG